MVSVHDEKNPRSETGVLIGKVLARLANVFLWAGAVAIIAMMLQVTADVVLKVAANEPIVGTLEIVSYVYMVGCTFLPLAHVQLSRSHIVVEVFTQKLADATNLRLEMGGALLNVLYLAVLAGMGFLVALDKTEIGETQDATFFQLPVWPMRWVFVGSCALTALIALYQMADDIRIARSGFRFDGSDRIRLGDHPM